MPDPSLRVLLRRLRCATTADGDAALSDAQLLERFVARRDEAAFELLVWRHGTMVLNLCRRLLHQEQDAEDAFQATFLVLARKATSIGKREACASWLYKVAYRIAVAARPRGTMPLADGAESLRASEATDDLLWRDLRPVLDEEVSRLPEKYRAAFVLCCLEGRTGEEAAEHLRCPRGTVLSRLARARERLRQRLLRRGVSLSAGLLTTLVAAEGQSAELTASLVTRTAKAALTAAAITSARAVALTEGVLRAMFMNKMKTVVGIVLTVGIVGIVAGLVGNALLADPSGLDPQEPNPQGAQAQGQDGGPAAGPGQGPEDAVNTALRRLESQRKLAMIGKALHNYAAAYAALPAPAIYQGYPEGPLPAAAQAGGAAAPGSGGGPPLPGTGGPAGGGVGGPAQPGSAGGGAGLGSGQGGATGPGLGGAGLGAGGGASGPAGGLGGVGPALDPNARPLLSWRVALLPFLGEHNLYTQFRRNEPWDSEHNRKLLAKMPAVYAPPGQKAGDRTYYQAIVGSGAVWEPRRQLQWPGGIPDGTSNTILLVEAAAPVPWTKPEDLPFVPDQALPRFGGLFGGDFHALFADGVVKLLSAKADEEQLRLAITPADGNPIDFDKLVVKGGLAAADKADSQALRRENEQLREALDAVHKKVAQEKAALDALKAKVADGSKRDANLSRLLEENADLHQSLERALEDVEKLKAEQRRLEQKLQRSAPQIKKGQ
jgi:RNA polymerase sigma-70 factor (ECF subfamily)